ncbi:hypothetical protein S7711_02596 [Stachybotrys chartarum IBT 7711]|uniref:Uncharacterized protein n=1 Tax=Stachybotrys chartarum (strain CBS 109288 / IBT 7711) TaxID=1280523 RepID=A0A084B8X3_STACB|nr:hypothetical protein S7711_02596 [Stachybotrys chartarum IBT 7711]
MESAASIITIWDLAVKIVHFAISVKDAPGAWQRYCDGLRTIASVGPRKPYIASQWTKAGDQIQTLLKSNIEKDSHLATFTIEDCGTHRPILEYIDDKLRIVREDAFALLQRFNDLAPGKAGQALNKLRERLRKAIRWTVKTTEFALSQDQIKGLMEGVDRAQSYLQTVLPLVMMQRLQSSELRQLQSADALDFIRAELLRFGKSLDEIRNDGERMLGAKLELPLDPGLAPVITRVDPGLQELRSVSSANALVFSRINTRAGGSSRPGVSPRQILDSTQDSGEDVETDQQEATVEFGYIFDLETCKMFQVPIESEDYRLALSPYKNPDSTHSPYLNHQNTLRADELVDCFSDDEWKELELKPMEEIMFMGTFTRAIGYATDAETNSIQSQVSLKIRPKSKVFIAETIRLRPCRVPGSSKLRFCVELINVGSEEQVFCVMTPCSASDRVECEHIAMEIEDGPAFSKPLPRQMDLTSLEHIQNSSQDELVDGSSSQSGTIQLFPRCHGGRRTCAHTVVENEGHDRPQCARQNTFYGLPLETENPSEDCQDDTERGPEPPDDREAPGVRLPEQPGPDDDIRAFELLRTVVLDGELPGTTRIDLLLLLQFVRMMVKYQHAIGDKPMQQARVWVSSLQPSTSFDEDAFTWLWIMWKLELGADFKKLSSVIQRQARSTVSLCQYGRKNRYNTKFPDGALELLDAQRSAALLKVRNMIESEMELYRRRYLQASTYNMVFDEQTMTSSLAFGYLRLECDRWLTQTGPKSEDLDFPGASFNDVHRAILAMVNLGGWKVSTLPPAERIYEPLAALSMFIPLVGASIRIGVLEGHLQGVGDATKYKLRGLIAELDNSD